MYNLSATCGEKKNKKTGAGWSRPPCFSHVLRLPPALIGLKITPCYRHSVKGGGGGFCVCFSTLPLRNAHQRGAGKVSSNWKRTLPCLHTFRSHSRMEQGRSVTDSLPLIEFWGFFPPRTFASIRSGIASVDNFPWLDLTFFFPFMCHFKSLSWQH